MFLLRKLFLEDTPVTHLHHPHLKYLFSVLFFLSCCTMELFLWDVVLHLRMKTVPYAFTEHMSDQRVLFPSNIYPI